MNVTYLFHFQLNGSKVSQTNDSNKHLPEIRSVYGGQFHEASDKNLLWLMSFSFHRRDHNITYALGRSFISPKVSTSRRVTRQRHITKHIVEFQKCARKFNETNFDENSAC